MQQLFLSAVVHFVKNINDTNNNKLYTSVINKSLMPACITIFNVDKRKTKNELSIRLKHLLALKNKSKKTSPASHSAENLHELDRYNNSKPLSFKIQITEFRSTICDLRQKSECQIDHRNDQKSIKI